MFCDEPVIDRILEDAELIIGRSFEAGKALVGGERGQDVAANRKFNAVEACLEIAQLAERIASAGRNDPDDLAAGLILQRLKKALRGSGEIDGVDRRIFLSVDRRPVIVSASLKAATPSRPSP
jgi:hypothetical protein